MAQRGKIDFPTDEALVGVLKHRVMNIALADIRGPGLFNGLPAPLHLFTGDDTAAQNRLIHDLAPFGKLFIYTKTLQK